jgi:peptidoglycan hydrolase CwlO-like protein
MNSRQALILLCIILLLSLIGVGYWSYSTHKSDSEQIQVLSNQIKDLDLLKVGLQQEVDSLQNAYANLANENELLQGSVQSAQKLIAEKEAVINKFRATSTNESKNLKVQIQQLLGVRTDLQASISRLQEENDSLRTLTGQLTSDLALAKSENEALSNLNKTIQEEVKRLTLANFKASAFRVEVEKRKPKGTVKAGRARRILVSFDLTGVAPEYRGVRPVYLVITDDKGTPIANDNPLQVKVTVSGSKMDIFAVKEQDINVSENQRLSFIYELDDKLKPGYYRVAVYTDITLLGAASFRLE